jgi:hypothetical protein
LTAVQDVHEALRPHVESLGAIQATLEPTAGTGAERPAQFQDLQTQFRQSTAPVQHHMGRVMASFAPGLFVGEEAKDLPQDHLDLERGFRQPKGHERRIHGHCHAGVRLVQEGPTVLLALDAHVTHPEPFTVAELLPSRPSPAPLGQEQALLRRTIMRRARSKKQRLVLLAELEQRYLERS